MSCVLTSAGTPARDAAHAPGWLSIWRNVKNESTKPIRSMHNIPINRHALFGTKVKMWCPTCNCLQIVIDHFPGGKPPIKLECGHRRSEAA